MNIYLITMEGCPKCIQAKDIVKQFPELRIKVLDKDERKAIKFIKKHDLKRAPAFVFCKNGDSFKVENVLEAVSILEEMSA